MFCISFSDPYTALQSLQLPPHALRTKHWRHFATRTVLKPPPRTGVGMNLPGKSRCINLAEQRSECARTRRLSAVCLWTNYCDETRGAWRPMTGRKSSELCSCIKNSQRRATNYRQVIALRRKGGRLRTVRREEERRKGGV